MTKTRRADWALPLKLLACFFLCGAAEISQVAISGTFKYPDHSNVSGKVEIKLTTSTVTNTCATPALVMTFKTVNVKITNGTMGALSLYATDCLSPRQYYQVRVYNEKNQVLYKAQWNVPKTETASVENLNVY